MPNIISSETGGNLLCERIEELESLRSSLQSRTCRLKIEIDQRTRQYDKKMIELRGMEFEHSETVNRMMVQIKDLEGQVQGYSGRMKEIAVWKRNLERKTSEFKDLETAYIELEQELELTCEEESKVSERKENYRSLLKSEFEEWIENEREKIDQELNLLHVQIQAEGRLHLFTSSDTAQTLLQEALYDSLRAHDQISRLSKVVSLQQDTICFLERHIDPDGAARLRAFVRQLRLHAPPHAHAAAAAAAAPPNNDPGDSAIEWSELLSASFAGSAASAAWASEPADDLDSTGPFGPSAPAGGGSGAPVTPPRPRAAVPAPRLVRASFAATLAAKLAALSPGGGGGAERSPDRPAGSAGRASVAARP
jgi:hypothetical protein